MGLPGKLGAVPVRSFSWLQFSHRIQNDFLRVRICATPQRDKLHDYLEFKGDHTVKGWVYQGLAIYLLLFLSSQFAPPAQAQPKSAVYAQVHFKEKRTGVGATNPGRNFL